MMSSKHNLEQLRNRAKDLKKAHASGDPTALGRIRAAFSQTQALNDEQLQARPLRLAQAQFVVAREAGYRSWPHMKHSIHVTSLTAEQRLDELIRAAVAGDELRVAEALDAEPELATRSPLAGLALAADPDLPLDVFSSATVNDCAGPLTWTALLYLCCAQYRCHDPDTRSNRVALAERLLSIGADPSRGVREADSVRGHMTALGGAIDRARNSALAQALLVAGADINDGPTLYEGSALWAAVRHHDVESLHALLQYAPPQWQLCHALPHCLAFNDVKIVRQLLDAGANPNWTMGSHAFGGNCLHEALHVGSDTEILRALLEAGAQVDFVDRDGRTPLSVAVRLGNASAIELLRAYGANVPASLLDQWIGACWQGERENTIDVESVDLLPTDHQWLVRAARQGRTRTVEALLSGEVDPNARDDDGETALHCAAIAGDARMCKALLDAGADSSALSYAGRTPLSLALQLADETARQRTVQCLIDHGANLDDDTAMRTEAENEIRVALFETAADAVVRGELAALEKLLDEHSWLSTARSSRAHRATLFHYLGANGVEGERQHTPANAIAVAELLLRAGSDPNALCFTYRGGPDQTTLGLMLSSDHPRNAGLSLPLAQTIVAGGGVLKGTFAILVTLYAALCEQRLPSAIEQLPSQDCGHALVAAAALGEAELVSSMLAAGVNANATRNTDVTALHEAAINGDEVIVDLLLTHGANPGLRDMTFNGDAAGWAHAGGHLTLYERLRAVE